MSHREVRAELLDQLPPNDSRSRRSRSDLRRINRIMGHAWRIARVLGSAAWRPCRITELGGGDGSLLLQVARRLGPQWSGVHLEIVDRHRLVEPATMAEFSNLGWTVEPVTGDVFDWLTKAPPVDCVIVNLFLHHFSDERLEELLSAIAGRTRALVACEPRRLVYPSLAGWLVAAIGCNGVTQHDAVASVAAGFRKDELTRLWPSNHGWRLKEQSAGLFSHCFEAWKET